MKQYCLFPAPIVAVNVGVPVTGVFVLVKVFVTTAVGTVFVGVIVGTGVTGVLVETGVVGTGVTPPDVPTNDITLCAGSETVKLPPETVTADC